MSTNLALVDPAVVPSRAPRPDRQHRPELVEVTPTAAQRRARPRIGYAVVAVAALGILLLAQLGISMVLSQGAYTLNSLSAEQTNLSRTQQSLSEQLRVLDSPQNLARNAQSLGMIANSTPVYLDPKTGRVYGTPTPAKPDEATASTENQVPNSLLNDVPLATKPGDTSTSKETGTTSTTDTSGTSGTSGTSSTKDSSGATGTTGTTDSTATSEKTSGASASDQGTAKSSVESDANPLQAPSTR
ncbi:hypothetical protein [Curtobacterium flaccumfaciens]|uniref:hypothetical protein n=1 Tax=Curtobacterium flaccumfaciens TaxID=2035 RepID=UPI000FFF4370|nr:hypothetical protein [Curtobacterium flaccumfaciens]MCS0646588.1 hypothetical protein [Curtobacterium flaccumfaciens pv. flaccumfaciens]MCS6526037.1 hypothetical protein [Curtobacterium flaccumfaciens pv. flaccumfaciens]MCS6528608.1 hypothetical protein [Curtobacterium flaccumfaciens pv. flaccumfaciens]NUU11481.1 hypothetical protein [Curtobacterium flaccumfaciens]RXF85367.1 hypothetical protein CffCFBP3418_00625 [Curtobacterium flaccumfaciens pv. flaccumfaciens]